MAITHDHKEEEEEEEEEEEDEEEDAEIKVGFAASSSSFLNLESSSLFFLLKTWEGLRLSSSFPGCFSNDQESAST